MEQRCGAGFAMLGAGIALTAWVGARAGTPWPPAAGTALAACIVLYDWHHKGNPLSPLVMGGVPRARVRHRRRERRRGGNPDAPGGVTVQARRLAPRGTVAALLDSERRCCITALRAP